MFAPSALHTGQYHTKRCTPSTMRYRGTAQRGWVGTYVACHSLAAVLKIKQILGPSFKFLKFKAGDSDDFLACLRSGPSYTPQRELKGRAAWRQADGQPHSKPRFVRGSEMRNDGESYTAPLMTVLSSKYSAVHTWSYGELKGGFF